MKKEKSEVTPKAVKRQSDFDDHALREFLWDSYASLREDTRPLMADYMEIHKFPTHLTGTKVDWAGANYLENRHDLLLLWSLHLHRQIVNFERESIVLLNWGELPW